MQRFWPVARQFTEQIVHLPAMDELVVIQHENSFSGKLFELITERGVEDCQGWLLPRLEQSQGFLTGFVENRAQGGDEIAQKEVEVAVVFIQRKPG